MGEKNGFNKYPKVRRIGDEENNGILESGHLVVKEKLDGANFRFTWDEDEERIVFGSRNVEYWNEKDTDNAFKHAVDYVRDNIDTLYLRSLQLDADGRVVVYGEAMHPHTLHYGEEVESDYGTPMWDDVPSFIGFDVLIGGDIVDWFSAEAMLESMELPTVPIVYEGDASEYDDAEVPVSEYTPDDGKAEGIVIVNEDTGQRAKLRTQEFKEKHSTQSVSNPDEYDPEDSAVLARQFTTEARVLKWIHKYRDRGRDVEMAMMEDLWRDVFDDIIEEEYDTIFLGNHVIDTQEFRCEVASITADVLQMYLNRPDGSVLNELEDDE